MPTSASLSNDVFRDHPVENLMIHNHLQDFHSVQELPESYVWTPSSLEEEVKESLNDVILYSSDDTLLALPVIDLTDPNAMQLMSQACRSWGVFQLTNHGISTDLLHRMEHSALNLFNLPMQQKIKAARSPDGVSGYGIHRLSSFFPKRMWSEGFTISGSPLEHARQLWPNDPQTFCNVVEEYENEMKLLSARLLWMLLGSLDVPKEDMKWFGTEGDPKEFSAALQFNFYPTCPDPDRAMGLAVHTDSTILTIVHQSSTIGGLQVLKDGVGWVTVSPVPGAFVVHVGDLLHILSNGLFHTVLHRAVVNRAKDRLSVAYFHGPPANVQISPVQSLIGPTRQPMYRPVTWSEYLVAKAKYFNEALSSIKLGSSSQPGMMLK